VRLLARKRPHARAQIEKAQILRAYLARLGLQE
jgi:hypothetical protein